MNFFCGILLFLVSLGYCFNDERFCSCIVMFFVNSCLVALFVSFFV